MATITAICTVDTKCDGTATVTASPKEPEAASYAVTVQNDRNGIASASPASAEEENEIILNIVLNDGCQCEEWQAVSSNVTISENRSLINQKPHEKQFTTPPVS